jgi:glycosyltransferase involved in cell wall biosynthesis
LLINATMLNDPELIGLGVYSFSLLSELLPMVADNDQFRRVVLVGDADRLRTLFAQHYDAGRFEIRDLRARRPVARLIGLHRAVMQERRRGRLAVYSMSHHGVWLQHIDQIVTVHDLFPLLFPDNCRSQHYYFQYYLPRLLSRCRAVVTDSQNSAEDLAAFYPSCPPVRVIPAALRPDVEKAVARPVPGLSESPFFLFVGPSFAHKNAERIIAAFAEIAGEPDLRAHRLVFTGGRDPYLTYLRQLVSRQYQDVSDRIVFLEYVGPGELAWLYGHAVAVVIATLYEGFGLPALEAMYFGCPVIASQVASLPEVCGDAALFVDPTEVSDIASAMRRIAADRQLKSVLIEKGRTNVLRFNWRKAAHEVLELLTESHTI